MYYSLWLQFKLFFNRQSRAVRWVSVILIVAFVGMGLFGVIHPARAGVFDCLGAPVDCAASIASNFLLWIASLIGKILVVLIDILLGIIQYNDFVRATAVSQGWVVIRDLCNMLFVAVLLMIAFGTILRIETYKYQRLLPQMIIMAVLVNFSKLIAGFVIDLSQVVLLTFANAFRDSAAGNFVSVFKLKEMLGVIQTDSTGAVTTTSPLSNMEKLGLPLFAIVLLVVALFVMLAMIVVFLARIVFLWVLVVLSPFAFMLSILPMTKSYASKWWNSFGRWTVTGPVLVFFIWLSLSVLGTGDTSSKIITTSSQGTAVNQGIVTAGLGSISSSENLLGFMLAVAMLVMAVGFAQSLGGFAGKFTGNMMGRLQKLGAGTLKLGGSAIKSLGKKADQAQMKMQKRAGITAPLSLRPSMIKEGWQAWRHQKEEEHYTAAKGASQDMFHRVFSREKTHYYDRAVRRRQSEEESKILSNKDDEIIHELEQAIKEKNADKIAGASRKLAKQADFDNFVRARGYHTGVDDSQRDMRALVRDIFMKEGGMTEQEAFRLGNDVGELAENNRQWGMSRAFGFDYNTGKFFEQTPEDWAKIVAAQQAKRDPQVIPRENHRTAYKSETTALVEADANGEVRRGADGLPILLQGDLTHAQEEDLVRTKRAVRIEADAGFHGAGESSWGNIDPAHANRLQPNARAAVMMNHPVDAHEIAPVLYNKVWESMAQMTPAELFKLEGYTKQPVVTDPHTGRVTQILQRPNLFNEDVAVPYEELSENFFKSYLNGKYDEWKESPENAGKDFSDDKVRKREFYHLFLQRNREQIERGRRGEQVQVTEFPPASEIPGQPATGPAPAAGTPLTDVDRAHYEATKAKVEKYQQENLGSFFASEEYQKGVTGGQFLERERFDEAKALEEYQSKYGTEGLRGVANYGAKGSNNVIGLDFSNLKVEGMDLSKSAGEFISDPAVLAQVKPQLLSMVDAEIASLNAKPDRTAGDNQRMRNLLAARDKINDEDQFRNLKLANLGRTGFSARHVLAHEDMHAQLAEADPDGKLQKEIWDGMSQEARQIATAQVKRKMSNQNMGEAQIISEYFAEGLANAGPATRADRSATAITLPASALQRLSEKTKVGSIPVEEQIVVPQAIGRRDRKQAEKQARRTEKDSEAQLKRQMAFEKEEEQAKKDLLQSQQDAKARAAEYDRAQQARRDLELKQAPQRRQINDRVRELQRQLANEKALMDEASAHGDQATAKTHQKNYNRLVPEINTAATQLEDLNRDLDKVKLREQSAMISAREATKQVQDKENESQRKSDARQQHVSGVIDVTNANERAQRDMETLSQRGVVGTTDAAKVTNAIRNNDYRAAFQHMEDIKKQIDANPEAYSRDVASLRDKIKNAEVSARLTVGTKMNDVVKSDIVRWQSEIAALTQGMTGQVDAIMKDMTARIPAARDLYKSSPKENIDKHVTTAVQPEASAEEKKASSAAVQTEMEKIAPPSTVVNQPPVRESVDKVKELLDKLQHPGLDDEVSKKLMGGLGEEINKLSSAIQGQKKGIDEFVKNVTNPLAHQAQLGGLGHFSHDSAEWKKFMYNMDELHKFFRDKFPKKGSESDVRHGDQPSSRPDSDSTA